MSSEDLAGQVRSYPDIIQGGMGVAISGWRLAGAVAAEGAAGVVSGTAIGTVLERRLQDGDMDDHMQQALAEFPDQDIVDRVMERYYLRNGRQEGQPYKVTPLFREHAKGLATELNILGVFTEVRRAQLYAQQLTGHGRVRGPIGVNFLVKLELPAPSGLYGAELAGADFVAAGAGIPSDYPLALDDLAEGKPATTRFSVTNDGSRSHEARFNPADYPKLRDASKARPAFGAIVASNSLAKFLNKQPKAPDFIVVEGYTAGGHNAPPRGPIALDKHGQPIYGPRDMVNIKELIELDLPFWLGGGYGTPEGLERARKDGANGIQVGSAFAVCEDSGMIPWARTKLIDMALNSGIEVLTSSKASPTGYPFKIPNIDNTLSVDEIYNSRQRICDQRLLSEPYLTNSGKLSFRCPAEPVDEYVKKGGDRAATIGRICLCNGLLAAAGLGQIRKHPVSHSVYQEPPVFTLGLGANEAIRRIVKDRNYPRFWAKDVLQWLRSGDQ